MTLVSGGVGYTAVAEAIRRVRQQIQRDKAWRRRIDAVGAELSKMKTPNVPQGFPKAQYNLGRLYYEGVGVPRDPVEAMTWFRAAAGQGLAAAQHNLGVMFAEGDGVPRDRAEAVKWFRRAAEQGHAAAQCNLGAMYYAGEGVPRDCVEACEWYALAVQGGVVVAEDGCRDLALEMSAGQMVEALRRCREFQPVKPGP